MNVLIVLLTHITAALSSVALSLYAYVRPSQTTLRIVYGLAGVTIITGTYLALTSPAHLLSSLISGFTYLAIVFAVSHLAQRRLVSVREKESSKDR